MYTILRLRQGHAPDPVSHLLARLLELFPTFAAELRSVNGGRTAILTLADSEDQGANWLTHKEAVFSRLQACAPALAWCTGAGYLAEIDTAVFGWLVEVRELTDAPAFTEVVFSATELRTLAALELGCCTSLYHPYRDQDGEESGTTGVTEAARPQA